MKTCRIYILLLTLSLGILFPEAQNHFKHITSSMGLASNNVKCIFEDRYGFMWFGTKTGLNYFDGNRLFSLNCYDKKLQVGNNNIGAIYEDTDGYIWVGTDRGIYIYNRHNHQYTFQQAKDPRTDVGATNWVYQIKGDKNGNVWALLPDQGMFRYHDNNVEFYTVIESPEIKKDLASAFTNGSNGDIIVATTGKGIYRYDFKRNKFHHIDFKGEHNNFTGISLCAICEVSPDTYAIVSNFGQLFIINTRTHQERAISYPGAGNIYVRDINSFGDEVWIASQSGVYVVDINTGTSKVLKSDPINPFTLTDNAIYTIYKDHNGGVWLGTIFGGVNYISARHFEFTTYMPSLDANSLSSKRIRGLTQDSMGQIWIGTEDNGLNVLNPQSGEIHRYNLRNPAHKIVLGLNYSNNRLNVCLSRHGIDVVDASGSIHSECHDMLDDNSVYCYLCDSHGREWVGMGHGLFRREPGNTEYQHIVGTGYDWIFDIYEAGDGTIWIATMGNGVWKYDKSQHLQCYSTDTKADCGLRSNSISAITEDSEGNIWLSTDRGGISRYNKSTDNFTTYGVAEGLPDDVAYDILCDDFGYLWFGTNRGLVRFSPTNKCVDVFTTADGLPGNQFNYHSAIKAADGKFYFGGIEGLVSFNPSSAALRQENFDIYFSHIQIMNKEVEISSTDSPLNDDIMFVDNLVLDYDESSLTLDVAAPAIGFLGSGKFSYKLKPIDKDWIATEQPSISFAKLSPGDYTLYVKVLSNEHEFIKTLKIKVKPQWWRSTLAYITYFLLISCIVITWFLKYKMRKERELKNKNHLFTIQKEKELYESKVKFFTEIAHEIRTPLTLISTPLEAVEEALENDDNNSRALRYLDIIKANTKRLLTLTGQLLDFHRIGLQQLKLKYESVDIVSLVNENIKCFSLSFSMKQKELTSHIPYESIIISVDKDAVTKILSNLLNNALKYARHSTTISMESTDEIVRIKVASDGTPIDSVQAIKIFEPFYQMENRLDTKNGIGIGLPLSRSLAVMHKGRLDFSVGENKENVFTLELPINQEDIIPNNQIVIDNSSTDYIIDDESNQSAEHAGYSIMLVEDNDTMRDFVAEQLSSQFTIFKASDGDTAISQLKDNNVDLIITDLMMPGMNGFELCRKIKQDVDLSHIPIIILTAKNDLQSKVTGLKCGAESYIEKPFSIKYLREQIYALLDNRRLERVAFSKKPFFKVDNMQMNKGDEEFMQKVIQSIESNMSDENFSVEKMSDILCMSRSTLLRKIKTVFNLSPLELIRLIKLKKAAEYIQSGKYRIGDVCEMIGINSPSYFSKLFLQQFGISPKDFEKQCQQQSQKAKLSLS